MDRYRTLANILELTVKHDDSTLSFGASRTCHSGRSTLDGSPTERSAPGGKPLLTKAVWPASATLAQRRWDDGRIGRVRDGGLIEILIDRNTLTGSVNLVGAEGVPLDSAACEAPLRGRPPHPGLAPHERLPDDSRLWAALQRASGGTWGGCVYDVDRIVAALDRSARDVREELP
jgi:hypothetical protein